MITRGTRLGPYEIDAPIGAGGMGEVYKGRDTRLDRSVAIKILPAHLSGNPAFKVRFEREARSISALNHPHICVLHDVGEANVEDGIPPNSGVASSTLSYLVMELCDGPTLAERLTRGPLPLDQVLRYAAEIADALDRAHRGGIVHRDLKPGNVMLTKSGVKLLDFGLAKAKNDSPLIGADGATELKPVTEEGTVVGTFQYMSPEQVEGGTVDHRSDIFAFGAILYEMVTGKRAFEAKSRASVIAAILDREPQPMSEIVPFTPAALERVVRTCLAKDPDERWQSAHDLRKELEWLRDGLSSPATVERVVTKRRNMERTAWTLAFVLPLIAAAAAWTFARRELQPPVRVVSAIAPRPGTEIVLTGDAAGPPELSRDGRRIAFVATTPEQGPMLYMQSLESGVTTVVPGSEKAMFPFWSPDGRSLGFFAAGKLMVSDLEGDPRPLADAPDSRGGVWAPDGTIFYTPYTQAPIMRIAASGGTPVAVTKLDSGYSTHRWPAVHPDGKHILYVAALHSDPDSPLTAIFMSSIDGKDVRKIVNSPGQGVLWRNRLLYLRANKLVAHDFDGGTLLGEPVPLWNNVLYDAGTWRTIFSVSDTGLLVMSERENANGSTVLQWIDREGRRVGELGPPAVYREASLSPDGKTAALTIGDPGSQIELHDLERGSRTRFSFVAGGAGDPIWSPDGKLIVFSTANQGRFTLYVKPVDGSSPERILAQSEQLLRPAVITKDNRYLLFEQGSGDASDIARIPLAGGKTEIIIGTEGQQYEARLSPDNKWLSYIDSSNVGRNLYVTTYPPGGGRWQASNESAYAAWWGPRGDEIFYVSAYGIRAVDVEIKENAVRVGTMKPLFNIGLNTNDRGISMSPDGTRFLAVPIRQSTSGTATLVTNFDVALRDH